MSGNGANPAVSVVIPLYNKAAYARRAIDSVFDQSFDDLEIIVVDDGSTDGGGEVVAAIEDPRLRLIRQANAGVAAARNVGVGAARGRWVAFLDADDTWRPDRLARQFAALVRAPDVVWAAGAFVTTGRGGRTRQIPDTPDAWFAEADVLNDALLILGAGWMLWTGTVMVRRDVLAQFGGFDPMLKVGEDVLLWTRLAVQHPRLVYVRTPIATYAQGVQDSLTKRAAAEGILDQLELARRLISLASALPAPRAALLHDQARRIVLRQIKNHLAFGRFRELRLALEVGNSLELGAWGKWLRIGMHLPSGPIARGIQWAIRLRRRLHDATEKP
jgi:glycosyltransferase involved in cell wall biosynthesis